MPSSIPLSGWFLDRAIMLDVLSLGFAGAMFRCSQERRQVIACYLSLGHPHRKFSGEMALGSFLLRSGHDEILLAAFGTIPKGMRAALRRAGGRTHPRRFYGYLYQILASDSRSATRRLIPQLPRVIPSILQTSRALSAELQTASLVAILKTSATARTVSHLVDLLEGADVDRAAMCRVLQAAKSMEDVVAFANKWAFRAKLPAHPVPRNDFYVPIEHASELKRIAFQYENCLRSMLANALDGNAAFAVVHCENAEAVVHLIHTQGSWQLLEICGRNNAHPTPKLLSDAVSYLKSQGIDKRKRFRSTSSKWLPLRRLVGRDFLQVEMDEILL